MEIYMGHPWGAIPLRYSKGNVFVHTMHSLKGISLSFKVPSSFVFLFYVSILCTEGVLEEYFARQGEEQRGWEV